MPTIETVSDSAKTLGAIILENLWSKAVDGVANARERSISRAQIIASNAGKLVPYVSNDNTIPSDLKRAVLLQQSISAFATRISAVRAFCHALNAVPLEGTDKVIVPFYDLETATSTDFDDSDGYLMGDTTTDSREVTINKRRYQSMAWSSKEFRRQPYLNLLQLAKLKAGKLGVDVWLDVASSITAANFPTVGYTGIASTFDSDKVAGLKLAAKAWPEAGRSLFVDSAYDANLLKDPYIKSAMNSGSTAALREGQAGQQLFGFEYHENPSIPGNSENLVGWINSANAILFAQSPIGPTEEVLSQLSRYEVVTDPVSGVSFEYRLWGNADMDGSREIIECNYGFDVGNADALQRLRSAA